MAGAVGRLHRRLAVKQTAVKRPDVAVSLALPQNGSGNKLHRFEVEQSQARTYSD
jgi:hypothetical protein